MLHFFFIFQLRSLVNSFWFLLERKVMYALNRLMPKTFIPLHTMVRLKILEKFLKTGKPLQYAQNQHWWSIVTQCCRVKMKPTNTLNPLLNMLNHCWQRLHLANIGLFFLLRLDQYWQVINVISAIFPQLIIHLANIETMMELTTSSF